jgi:prepilin-type N-terminal cleavage/methylation domain-containing protein/prepilin-type processing-associated H-X9-DG protein
LVDKRRRILYNRFGIDYFLKVQGKKGNSRMKISKRARTRSGGFTLIELLIVIAIIALLMGILLPALTKVRRQGKRAACLAHTRQLQIAWQAYAETYDGTLVNGGRVPYPVAADYGRSQRFWCSGWPPPGYDWDWNPNGFYPAGEQFLTYTERVEKMKGGALWPFLREEKAYRCTEARKEFHRTFSIVQSMNSSWTGQWAPPQGEIITNLGQVKKASERIVFVEEGQPSPNGYMVIHDISANGWIWIDKPQAPHVKGSNFSFVDGHAEFWKWEDPRTLAWASVDWTEENAGSSITTDQTNNKDLVRVIKATWGDIKGYTPKK